MTDEAESSVQSILNEFHLKNENISKLSSVYDDLDGLVQLVRRGQTNITLHCIDREELGQTNQVISHVYSSTNNCNLIHIT